MIGIPLSDNPHRLRHVTFRGHKARLILWDTNQRPRHHTMLGYAFYINNNTEPLFVGDDFGCPPHLAIDSNSTILSLLSFLTLRPGDTDADYFAQYNEQQTDWAESSECEALGYDRLCAEENPETPFIIDL